jgi:hypothetical protein
VPGIVLISICREFLRACRIELRIHVACKLKAVKNQGAGLEKDEMYIPVASMLKYVIVFTRHFNHYLPNYSSNELQARRDIIFNRGAEMCLRGFLDGRIDILDLSRIGIYNCLASRSCFGSELDRLSGVGYQ